MENNNFHLLSPSLVKSGPAGFLDQNDELNRASNDLTLKDSLWDIPYGGSAFRIK
jgi:hypothetical protein